MISLVFALGLWFSFFFLARFLRLVGKRIDWGQSFRSDAGKLTLLICVAGSREAWLSFLGSGGLSPRSARFGLALSGGALAYSVFVAFVAPLSFVGDFLRGYSAYGSAENPMPWLHWLAMSDWSSLALAILVGGLARVLCRFSGFVWVFVAGLLTSGGISFAVAWGIFLGDILAGTIELGWRHAMPEFRLRLGVSLALGLVAFLVTPVLSLLFAQSGYSPTLRLSQWGFAIVFFLVVETLAGLAFFHFYHARNPKLS